MKKSVEKYYELAHPSEWFHSASELFESSEVLFNNRKNTVYQKRDKDGNVEISKYGISRTYLLLIGFAIENVIKAKLISENPEYVKEGKIDSNISKGHDLLKLFDKIRTFTIDDKEVELLKMLSEAIPYWGRYPIPKRWEMINKEQIATEDIRNTFIELYHRHKLSPAPDHLQFAAHEAGLQPQHRGRGLWEQRSRTGLDGVSSLY
ncbi:MAG: hypothetical protein IPN76_09425 [Saprospiraceae bacterium]|nr:hypothetical protein [Saprospiraceae bacterium]